MYMMGSMNYKLNNIFCTVLLLVTVSTKVQHSVIQLFTIEMGRMSDYNIRPKPKVWAGSPNEC